MENEGINLVDLKTACLDKSQEEEEPILEENGPVLDSEWYEEEEKYPLKFSWRKLMGFAGPGLLMSMAYLDPGNIAGDLFAGVKGRYALIWVLLWSTVLGWYYQVLSARLGVAT